MNKGNCRVRLGHTYLVWGGTNLAMYYRWVPESPRESAIFRETSVKYIGNGVYRLWSILSMLFGRWQQRCGLLLSVSQQLS